MANRARVWRRRTIAALAASIIIALGGAWPPGFASGGDVKGATLAALPESALNDADQDVERLLYEASKGEDYDAYLSKHADQPHPDRNITLEGAGYSAADGMTPELKTDFEGRAGHSVLTTEQGSISWDVNVQEAGLYQIEVAYYPIAGKSASIQRSLLLDGKVPFVEADNLALPRVWADETRDPVKLANGSERRPEQVERPRWQEVTLADLQGYHDRPFSFYFSAGSHRVTLVSRREPAVIGQIRIFKAPEPPAYEDLAAGYAATGLRDADARTLIEIQGERAAFKSSPSLYPISDHSSPAVTPYSASAMLLNTIGGNNWRVPGDWIEWEFDAPESGLYTIGIKAKQNSLKGMNVTRKLMLDGEVPFQEMNQVAFEYSGDWKTNVLGGKQPYRFYLAKGKHSIRLEVTLGGMAPIINEVKASLVRLNEAYRRIIMLTGTTPDPFRDYQADRKLPGLVQALSEEHERLAEAADRMERLSGKRSDKQAVLETMADQLVQLQKHPESIPKRLASFKANIGALGDWILQTSEQPLTIDSLYVASPEAALPTAKVSFWKKLKHSALQFYYSFTIDYNEIGEAGTAGAKPERDLTVWVGTGRDQAEIIQGMIDDTFAADTGIHVKLELIPINVLLPATLSGAGPDVAIQIGNASGSPAGNDLPLNYAMRGAVQDISQFPGYGDVAARFRDSALAPYRYADGVYALPETQSYPMLFYRKDILEELGLSLPQTWQDVEDMLPVLNRNHMEFGLPQPIASLPAVDGQSIASNSVQNLAPNAMFSMLLMQQGGEFYRDGGRRSALDSDVAASAFRQWTDYYTDYKLTKEYDFANRFRTGETPIGIADFTAYNQLSVFAPEIKGLWGFAPVPGVKGDDGVIRRDVPSGGTSVLMMSAAHDKDAAWSFMKWWTSERSQTRFAREMEGLLGAAARYPTANLKSFESLPWPKQDYDNLMAQAEWVRGIPEVPGGYFTGRYVINAFYHVMNDGMESREALDESVDYIQEEIKHKREEFKLPN
ncbi:extracellular solute-binding protein [Cohnella sp. 56]|uniref:extracellular solute-binding protein n=1 Tax=Cohnella sp. 56 TaxID=3113722 RepID=UPI0030E930CF